MPNRNSDDDKGLLWKLPVAYSNKLGKLGPAFGLGAGCGVGFGVGLIGGNPFSRFDLWSIELFTI